LDPQPSTNTKQTQSCTNWAAPEWQSSMHYPIKHSNRAAMKRGWEDGVGYDYEDNQAKYYA